MKLWQLQRQIKFLWQKATRGFSDDVTWNLDYEIAKWVYPRLVRFKELNDSHPTSLTPKQWDKSLDEMIFTFRTLSDEPWDLSKQDKARVKRGLRIFAKHFHNLWS